MSTKNLGIKKYFIVLFSLVMLMCCSSKLQAERFDVECGKLFVKTHYPCVTRNSKRELADFCTRKHLVLNEYIRHITSLNRIPKLLLEGRFGSIGEEVFEAATRAGRNLQDFLFNLTSLSDAFICVYLEQSSGAPISPPPPPSRILPRVVSHRSPNHEHMQRFVRARYNLSGLRRREDFLSMIKVCSDKCMLLSKYIEECLSQVVGSPMGAAISLASKFVGINDEVFKAFEFYKNNDQFIADLRVIEYELLNVANDAMQLAWR